MVDDQKPMLDNRIENDRISYYVKMMLTAPITINPEN